MRADSSHRPARPGRLGRLSVERVSIKTKTIELAAFLKWAQVVGTGGQAKALIQGGRVKVNGQVELRRGRALAPGDRVEVGARVLEVIGA
jgi:ribosome-associated protein